MCSVVFPPRNHRMRDAFACVYPARFARVRIRTYTHQGESFPNPGYFDWAWVAHAYIGYWPYKLDLSCSVLYIDMSGTCAFMYISHCGWVRLLELNHGGWEDKHIVTATGVHARASACTYTQHDVAHFMKSSKTQRITGKKSRRCTTCFRLQANQ